MTRGGRRHPVRRPPRHARLAVRALAATVAAALALGAGGCRQVQLAGPDRAVTPFGTATGVTAAPGPPAGGSAARPLAGPAAAAGPDDVIETVRAAAPPALVTFSRPGWIVVRGTDGQRRMRTHVVWQGHDPGRVRRLAAGGSSGGEADAGPEPGVRTSRWRSRTWTWPPRGIAVRLHGLHESPLDRALDRRLLGAGWMLLHFDSIQLGGIGFAERPGGRTELALDSAEEAGGLVDEILAQVAVAATEVLGRERDWLREHEGLDDAPVIVVGTSLGGILSPTVAALVDGELRREGSGLAAMVLLAAGGDLGGISAASPAMDLGPDLVPPLALLRWKGLMREAIAWSRLDPLHVAPALRHVPTLMLHGRFDDVVPARFGDRLWRALGRPDRYRYLVGHYGLLGLMTGEADAVMRWLRRLEAAAAGEERRATR